MKLLTIRFNDEKDYNERVQPKLRYTSYERAYWRGIVPPNSIEITLGPLSEKGVENWIETFKETGIAFSARTEDVKK